MFSFYLLLNQDSIDGFKQTLFQDYSNLTVPIRLDIINEGQDTCTYVNGIGQFNLS